MIYNSMLNKIGASHLMTCLVLLNVNGVFSKILLKKIHRQKIANYQ